MGDRTDGVSRKPSMQVMPLLCGCNYAGCLPQEILYQIAFRLDLPAQTSLACTNKHNHALLQGKVQYIQGFRIDTTQIDDRVQAEAFALNGIDLLPELPSYVDEEVAMLYMEYVQAEAAAITYSKGRFRNQVICYYIIPAEEDSDRVEGIVSGHTDLQRGDRVMFVQLGDKQMLHKVLSNAPFGMNRYDGNFRFDAGVLFKSKKRAHVMDHCRCAQLCFDRMCSMVGGNASLYICFAKHEFVYPGIPIQKRTTRNGDVQWFVDDTVVQHPVKINFEWFPEATVQVQAHFTCNFEGFDEPQIMPVSTYYNRIDIKILQQSVRFVYNQNLGQNLCVEAMQERLEDFCSQRHWSSLVNNANLPADFIKPCLLSNFSCIQLCHHCIYVAAACNAHPPLQAASRQALGPWGRSCFCAPLHPPCLLAAP